MCVSSFSREADKYILMMGIESGFGHGDDDDYVEEELLVYADFQSKIASSTLRDTANVKIIGLETGEPIMEIGDKIFQGICNSHH